jgi:3-methylornithine--L-lysine ligase
MRLLVVGGKLQGTEAVYLGKKAGMEVTLIDKNPRAPARNIANTFVNIDAADFGQCYTPVKDADLVLPAVEDKEALEALGMICAAAGTPCLYDFSSYHIASSKKRSKEKFAAWGIPAPRYWPDCGYPLILKPSEGSGSRGVRIIEAADPGELDPELFLADGYIAEEFLHGRHYSVEVTGSGGNYRVHQITMLEMDGSFDCKRVIAPADLDDEAAAIFRRIAYTIAERLELRGIMDVEAVYNGSEFFVLEIDARLPSQTPIAVYWSSGLNLVEIAAAPYAGSRNENGRHRKVKAVVLEHILAVPGGLYTAGEHVMADADELHVENGFFGADEGITNYRKGKTEWAATLICTGSTQQCAYEKRTKVIQKIMADCGIDTYRNDSPHVSAGADHG